MYICTYVEPNVEIDMKIYNFCLIIDKLSQHYVNHMTTWNLGRRFYKTITLIHNILEHLLVHRKCDVY